MKSYALAALAVVALIASANAAEPPRKIDFTVVLTDQDDKPWDDCSETNKDGSCKTLRPLTLGIASLRALSVPDPGGALALDESTKRGNLALKVYKATDAELTVEEISLIKKQLPKAYNPVVVTRAGAILDPVEAKK